MAPERYPLTCLEGSIRTDSQGATAHLFVSDLIGDDVVELTPGGTQTTIASGLHAPWAVAVGPPVTYTVQTTTWPYPCRPP